MKCKHLFILMAFMLPWLALAEEYRGLDSMEGATLTTDQTPPTKATLVIPGFQTVTVQLEEEEQNVAWHEKPEKTTRHCQQAPLLRHSRSS